jgi:predicted esterase
MNPKEMLDLVLPAVGADKIIASVEAPNQHFLAGKPGDGGIGYNWGTPAHWQSVIRMHREIVLGALDLCRARFGTPASRTVLLGFSQPVGLNYRLIATEPGRFGAVIGICGGVPRDWEDPSYLPVTAAILHIARDQDEYYPNGVAASFPERLRSRAADVEFHLIPGPHRFPVEAADLIQPWLGRVTG